MADFEIRASRDLLALAQRLKEADRPLRNELLRRVRTAGQAAIPDVRKSALETLPRRGGLAERVAGQVYRVQASYAGAGTRVRIAGQGMKELDDIDAGRLRHPVWGNRTVWRQQSVKPGFFSETIRRRTPKIRTEIERGMAEVAHMIEKGI